MFLNVYTLKPVLCLPRTLQDTQCIRIHPPWKTPSPRLHMLAHLLNKDSQPVHQHQAITHYPWCILSRYMVQWPQQEEFKRALEDYDCDLVLCSHTSKPGIMGYHQQFLAHQPGLDLLLLPRQKECSTKARGQASTPPLTLRARLKKGPLTALRTVGRTLVSCQPELGAGQTRHKVTGTPFRWSTVACLL